MNLQVVEERRWDRTYYYYLYFLSTELFISTLLNVGFRLEKNVLQYIIPPAKQHILFINTSFLKYKTIHSIDLKASALWQSNDVDSVTRKKGCFFPSAHPNNSNRCNFYKRRCIGLRNEHFQTLYEWAIKSSILVYILGIRVETCNYLEAFEQYVDKRRWVRCPQTVSFWSTLSLEKCHHRGKLITLHRGR